MRVGDMQTQTQTGDQLSEVAERMALVVVVDTYAAPLHLLVMVRNTLFTHILDGLRQKAYTDMHTLKADLYDLFLLQT